MPAKKRKDSTPAADTNTQAVAEPQATAEPDVFDHVIAARAAGTGPAAEAFPAEPSPDEAAAATAYQPDPHSLVTVPLGDWADAPAGPPVPQRDFRRWFLHTLHQVGGGVPGRQGIGHDRRLALARSPPRSRPSPPGGSSDCGLQP